MNSYQHLRFSSQVATALFVTLCLAINPEVGRAQAPRTISHQGILTDPSGTPVADASRSMTFAIYDVSSSGSPLWTETKDVETIDGIFNTQLGSSNPITGVNFNQDLWLGITVAGDPEMSERTKLASVPSAFGLVMPFEGTLTADQFAYTVEDTLYASIPGSAFAPETIDTMTVWDGGAFTDHSSFLDIAVAPVFLPHGAIIRSVSCTYYDVDTTGDLSCRLCVRSGTSACGTILAGATSSGDAGLETYASSALSKTVDNENESYVLRVYAVQGPANFEWKNAGSDLEVVRANVMYTMARPQ